jgi:hypothetical protein
VSSLAHVLTHQSQPTHPARQHRAHAHLPRLRPSLNPERQPHAATRSAHRTWHPIHNGHADQSSTSARPANRWHATDRTPVSNLRIIVSLAALLVLVIAGTLWLQQVVH